MTRFIGAWLHTVQICLCNTAWCPVDTHMTNMHVLSGYLGTNGAHTCRAVTFTTHRTHTRLHAHTHG